LGVPPPPPGGVQGAGGGGGGGLGLFSLNFTQSNRHSNYASNEQHGIPVFKIRALLYGTV